MPGITDFVANFQGGARANLYRVYIDRLDSVTEFLCKGAQLPGRTINPIEVRYLNNTVKVAGDTVFQDWTVTIINDLDFRLRVQLEDWQSAIKQRERTEGDPGLGYFASATVEALDANAVALAAYTFYNLWPNDIAAIDMGFDQQDTIQEYQVTFSYSYWEKTL